MTDKELIQVLRYCDSPEGKCADCPLLQQCRNSHGVKAAGLAADRLEALLAEDEHLREVTKMVPRWRPVSQPPEKYGRYLCTVKSKVVSGNTYICTCDYDEDGFSCGFDRSYDVSHWMPLPEPPSTEGVE